MDGTYDPLSSMPLKEHEHLKYVSVEHEAVEHENEHLSVEE